MNCFTHALPFLDDAYFVVGSCLPDWLSAFDRKCRLREKAAREFVEHQDPIVAAVARGVVQHHQDDDWFHRGPAFNEMILNYGMELRQLLGGERSMRPSFVGHIIVEIFLDAYLHDQHPGQMDRFYRQVESVDPEKVQAASNRFATRETEQLANGIRRFVKEKFLYDYSTDEGVVFRINQVMKRVGLSLVPPEVLEWTPNARQQVYDRAAELLPQYQITI